MRSVNFVGIVMLLLLIVGCGGAEPDAEPFVLTGELPLAAVDSALVGTTVEVLAGPVAVPDGYPATLTFSSSYGSQLLRATFQDGYAWFELRPEMTTRSGSATVVVTAGEASGLAYLEMVADTAVSPVIPFVGAKSIIADGGHYAMAVMIPFDQYGNLLPDGTPVNVMSSHPTGDVRSYQPEVKAGLAWEEIYSTIKAGRTAISAVVQGAFGPEGTLLEIPGWPTPFEIFTSPEKLPADGFHLMNVRSDIIVDRHGNAMPDGTIIKYQLIHSDGTVREYPTYTVDGIAEVKIQTPRTPGVYQLRGTAFGMQTPPIAVEFFPGPAIGKIEMDLSLNKIDNEIWITAGPIVGPLNQFVADGTEVTFTIAGENGRSWSEIHLVDAGYATWPLRRTLLDHQTYRVTAIVGAGSGEFEFTIRKN